jgi:hypothetical protein
MQSAMGRRYLFVALHLNINAKACTLNAALRIVVVATVAAFFTTLTSHHRHIAVTSIAITARRMERV